MPVACLDRNPRTAKDLVARCMAGDPMPNFWKFPCVLNGDVQKPKPRG
jgi:hypothetical protein